MICTITKPNVTNENNQRRKEWLRHQHIIALSLHSISLTNPVHINANVDFTRQIERIRSSGTTMLNDPIIVKWEGYGQYSLITGLKGFKIAQALNHEMILCVVIDCDRKEYLKEVGFKKKFGYMYLDRIIIPKPFQLAGVNPNKVQKYIDYYNEHGKMDAPILIKGERLLVDKYARYEAYRQLGINRVLVEYKI